MLQLRQVFLVGLISTALWGQRPVSVDVAANRAWNRTGIFLGAGNSVVIEASGTIDAVPPNDQRPFFHRVPPEGRPERQPNKPQPFLPSLVLLARIGNGPVMEVGARAEFPAGDPYGTGELQLGINDDFVDDNSGSWNVRITVRGSNLSQQDRNSSDRRGGRRDGYQDRRQDAEAASMIERKAQQVASYLGPATGSMNVTADGIGRSREYRNGAIYWYPNIGAFEVHGAIREQWVRSGGEQGQLGYPVSDESAGPGGSRINRFQHGSITWDERNGSRVQLSR
jgi:hypothetical protein